MHNPKENIRGSGKNIESSKSREKKMIMQKKTHPEEIDNNMNGNYNNMPGMRQQKKSVKSKINDNNYERSGSKEKLRYEENDNNNYINQNNHNNNINTNNKTPKNNNHINGHNYNQNQISNSKIGTNSNPLSRGNSRNQSPNHNAKNNNAELSYHEQQMLSRIQQQQEYQENQKKNKELQRAQKIESQVNSNSYGNIQYQNMGRQEPNKSSLLEQDELFKELNIKREMLQRERETQKMNLNKNIEGINYIKNKNNSVPFINLPI